MLKIILLVVEIVEMSTADAEGGGRMVMVVVIRRGKTQIQHLIRRK
jgi:hypothetical protein